MRQSFRETCQLHFHKISQDNFPKVSQAAKQQNVTSKHHPKDAQAVFGVSSHEDVLELHLGCCHHCGKRMVPKEFLVLLQLANKEEIEKMSDDKIAVGDKHKESEDQHSHGAQEIAW